MEKYRFKNKKILLLILFPGIVGVLFFFPVQMSGRYTCVYHRLFEAENPVTGVNMENNNSTATEEPAGTHDHSESPFLHRYLHNYAILWWISLLLIVFSIYGLRQNRVLNKKSEDLING